MTRPALVGRSQLPMATRGGLSQRVAHQGGESLARCRSKQAETLLKPRRVEREEEPRSVPTYRTQADPRAARNEHGGSSGCPLGSIVERDVDLAAMDEHEFVLGQMVVHSHRIPRRNLLVTSHKCP